VTLFYSVSSFSQTYISNKSSYSDPESYDEIFVEGEKKIVIVGNEFFLTLPPNDVKFSGTFKRGMSNSKNGKSHEILKIDGGGLIDFGEDLIWVNLYATDFNNGYTFYLENFVEPTEEEKRISKERIDTKVADYVHQNNVEIFGKFTADCIKNRKIKIGMKEIAIPIILGDPNYINTIETTKIVSKQYVFENKYVYTENGKVVAIQISN